MNVSSHHHLKYSLQQHINQLRGWAAFNKSVWVRGTGQSGWHLPFSYFLHYIPWPNKVLLKEMQKMQKVTFTDVYFRDRIIYSISKINTRFLLEKRMERLKRVQKGIGIVFPKGNCTFLRNSPTLAHKDLFIMGGNRKTCGSWTSHQRQWHWGNKIFINIPCRTNYLEGLPDVNILK